MKYTITLLILLVFLTYCTIKGNEFPLIVNIVLAVSIFTVFVAREYSIFNKNFESTFKMRSQKKTIKAIKVFDFIFAIVWTLPLYFNNNYNKNTIIIFFILVCTFPVFELIIGFIYREKKPYTIFIKENELIIKQGWILKRNLAELNQIQYNRFSKNLKLDFKSKSEVSIKTTEYKIDDIQTLLEILIEKSENKVFIPNNYKPKIKTAANNV